MLLRNMHEDRKPCPQRSVALFQGHAWQERWATFVDLFVPVSPVEPTVTRLECRV
jgi:hypothetical protein